MSKLSRRALAGAVGLAATGVVPAARAAAAFRNPDAKLIAVCAEFIARDRQVNAIYDGPNAIVDDDAAAAAAKSVLLHMYALVDQMEALRASTARGIQARAASLAQHAGGGEFSFDAEGTITCRMLDYLLRDAAAIGASVG